MSDKSTVGIKVPGLPVAIGILAAAGCGGTGELTACGGGCIDDGAAAAAAAAGCGGVGVFAAIGDPAAAGDPPTGLLIILCSNVLAKKKTITVC